jgi:arylsulfatase A-like enzyme
MSRPLLFTRRFGLCILALACRSGRAAPATLSADVVSLAPVEDFSGNPSLFIDKGWGKPEGPGGSGDWGDMAWAVGRESVIQVPTVAGQGMDFYARALPYPWEPGSPPQTVELMFRDRVVGSVELELRWHDFRIPLPDDFSSGRVEALRLRFTHALSATGDPRKLSAAFTRMAVLPRRVTDPLWFLGASTFDAESGKLAIPVRGGVAIPLPAASSIRLRPANVGGQCADCRVSAELDVSPSVPLRSLWRGSVAELSALDLRFDTEAKGVQRLLLRVSPVDEASDSRSTLELRLGPEQLEARGSGVPSAPDRPHVFVYVVDTLRADALSPFGARQATPWVRAFADDAVTYLQAVAPSSWTLPSVMSLLTGQYPDRHGVTKGVFVYDPERTPSLQTLLGRYGYRTLGISHSGIVSQAYGLEAGFQSFYLGDRLNGWKLGSEAARGLLAAVLHDPPGLSAPVFAYLHTVDPHAPYVPVPGSKAPNLSMPLLEYRPREFAAKGFGADPRKLAEMRGLYDGEAVYADAQFGRFVGLLKWLNLYDNSFVVFAADHGEEFGEHGGFEHGETLFQEVLRVPLLVKYPHQKFAGARVSDTVSLVDVAPTIVSGVGLPVSPDSFDGEVLNPGPVRRRGHAVYFDVGLARNRDKGEVPVDLRGVVAGLTKCIENRAGVDRFGKPAPALLAFDLGSDPGEQRPMLENEAVTRCRSQLEAWSAERAQVGEWRSRRTAPPESLERLRALGYIE